ncbi:uncharacterized protein LOC127247067 isoform X2 [Andrographis paniculata]|uniref:uncharacterized protein LOC127247067 isoform X2 n=1 Tax=Andrographis paniculata TaxID=175694 RepID=UPI0021E84EED|nr:uncharacterized protein LOC127247067 isoform X2 [Andrographis paniculata]
MLQAHRHLSPFSSTNGIFPSLSPLPSSLSLCFPSRNPNRCYARKTWTALIADESITAEEPPPAKDGPIELFPTTSPIFATSDEPTPIQTATSVLLTGAITVFLFRSLRRRAKIVKEKKFRSSGDKKSLVDEAMATLKSLSPSADNAKSPPSPVQAFLGALGAAAIALILYKFTITIESSLNRQTISDSYSVRQITITIRTIINGLCYLATFVFGANSLGLFLYSGQLAFKSLIENPNDNSRAPSNPPADVADDQSSEDIQ